MIDVKIKNIDQFIKAYGKVGQITQKEMKDALNKSSAIVERDAKRLTPVDTGHLRRSIQKPKRVSAGDTKTAVGSNVKYAYWVHKFTHYKHKVGEAKFLEKAFNRNLKKMNKIFDQMIENIIKKLTALTKR